MVCELEDRLDTALDDADDDDDDGDFADRLSSEEARAGEELVGAACGRRYTSSNESTQSSFSASKLCRARSPAS